MSEVTNILLMAAVLLFSLAVHEFAHAWTAFYFGDDTAQRMGRLTLNPIAHLDPIGALPILFGIPFGWAKPVPVDPRRVRNPNLSLPLIAAAGPISNLIQMALASFLWFLFIRFNLLSGPVGQVMGSLLYIYIKINLVLALFNLFPIFPLDGSRVVPLFLSDSAAERYESIAFRFGFMPLFALFALDFMTKGAILGFWFSLWGPAFNWFFVLLDVPLNLSRVF